MADPAATRPRIDNPDFQHAVDLIDAGAASELSAWIDEHPELLTECAAEDGSFAGEYFKHPRLIWFVAENPIRNGKLPANIAEVTRVLATAARHAEVTDLTDQLNYTLALVTSGCVPRECGVQVALAEALVDEGADVTSGLQSGLAHRETAICELLIEKGAEVTLAVAAGLGHVDALQTLLKHASEDDKSAALAMAGLNGQSTVARILVDTGADPNRYCPEGMGAHATPLHHAIAAGSVKTVCTLVTRGADVTLKDKIFDGNAKDWAFHCGQPEISALLDEAEVMLPAIRAVRTGDVDALDTWLAVHPERIDETLGDNPRTLLHYATDWPGHRPRVGETIRALITAGADPNVRYRADAVPFTETPLHWAASSDDVEALEALIDGGAMLDPTGGCIANGTPLVLAVIFQNWKTAEFLVAVGAKFSLPLVAGLGRMDLVKTFFGADGRFENPYGDMPHCDTTSDAQRELNGAILLASMAGHLPVVQFAHARGADVNAISSVETTPLDEALNHGHGAVVEFLRARSARNYADL